MKAVRCENGHFYDANKYRACPYCHEELRYGAAPSRSGNSGDDEKTSVASYNHTDNSMTDAREETRILFEAQGFTKEPPAGWLVCVKGADKGKGFRVYNGQNTIGRGESSRISLSDTKISRKVPAASILYDALNMAFYISHGDSNAELITYLNGQPVFELTLLAPYDRITIGDTVLVFVPLCSDEFSWDYKGS